MALACFRLGDTGLGNRDTHPLKHCLLCSIGENKESHLVFSCPAMWDTIQKDCPLLQSFTEKTTSHGDPDAKLQSFLGGDLCSLTTLQQRGRELALLLKTAEDKVEAFLENNSQI